MHAARPALADHEQAISKRNGDDGNGQHPRCGISARRHLPPAEHGKNRAQHINVNYKTRFLLRHKPHGNQQQRKNAKRPHDGILAQRKQSDRPQTQRRQSDSAGPMKVGGVIRQIKRKKQKRRDTPPQPGAALTNVCMELRNRFER